jgi:hypothetical protein
MHGLGNLFEEEWLLILLEADTFTMATADVSAFVYFGPIFAFLLVFLVIFMVLKKSKMFENPFMELFFSFVVATIFVTAGSIRQLVLNVVPWFAVLIFALFLLMALFGFMGKADLMTKPVGITFAVILMLIFVIAGIKVFSAALTPYLPGSSFGDGGDPTVLGFFDWLYSPRVAGAILLLAVAGLVSWVITRPMKK